MNMKDKGPNDLEKNVFDLMRENHRLKMQNAIMGKRNGTTIKKT
jgi:ribosomal protein L29